MSNTFIDSTKNDFFSSLRGIDLQELLVETENYLLEYRDKLNLPDYVTFGTEIEYEGLFKVFVTEFIENNLTNWVSAVDYSLMNGGEIQSPIMRDEIKYWQDLKKVCNYLSKKKVDTAHNAGGHIHIGAHVLGEDVSAWIKFLKLYTAYENVLFRFAYGDKINNRRKMCKYAIPTADILYDRMDTLNNPKLLLDIIFELPIDKKNLALNFYNVDSSSLKREQQRNTIEFRSPNATTNEVIWQNNINTFTKMLVSAKNKTIDEDFLNYKLNNEYLSYRENEYMYSEVNLKNTLEFVDLTFDNNLDKVYFLRQYLKDFQVNYGAKKTIAAKKFVR